MTFVVKHFNRYNLFQINSVCKATRYFWKGKQGVFMAPCFEFEVLLLKKKYHYEVLSHDPSEVRQVENKEVQATYMYTT